MEIFYMQKKQKQALSPPNAKKASPCSKAPPKKEKAKKIKWPNDEIKCHIINGGNWQDMRVEKEKKKEACGGVFN